MYSARLTNMCSLYFHFYVLWFYHVQTFTVFYFFINGWTQIKLNCSSKIIYLMNVVSFLIVFENEVLISLCIYIYISYSSCDIEFQGLSRFFVLHGIVNLYSYLFIHPNHSKRVSMVHKQLANLNNKGDPWNVIPNWFRQNYYCVNIWFEAR